MDSDSRITIDWLRARPPNGVVRWASDHLDVDAPWATAWIDVRVPDGGPPGMGWVWTIVRPDEAAELDPEQLWEFAWPCDLDADGAAAWSPGAVCQALSDWAARHAGRGDLRFEWDHQAGHSPMLVTALERAEAGGPVWDLGDGLRVVDGAFDDLLALPPDEAAKVTAAMREAGRRALGEG